MFKLTLHGGCVGESHYDLNMKSNVHCPALLLIWFYRWWIMSYFTPLESPLLVRLSYLKQFENYLWHRSSESKLRSLNSELVVNNRNDTFWYGKIKTCFMKKWIHPNQRDGGVKMVSTGRVRDREQKKNKREGEGCREGAGEGEKGEIGGAREVSGGEGRKKKEIIFILAQTR